MFPAIDVGTFLKTFQAKVFPDWKKKILFLKNHLVLGKICDILW